ncbi:MAG: GTPase HflX [Candidatus Latescibacteria bacterium]|nr:GTPase HflX [Candidatus Latescibacterota bacterium]NIM22672.1 GTPase HflX [Candidatus Latescibacterota bacterium]NIM64961.1 GTPase HflX [Candidatus Latescibacterota bacterium]NIO01476.1 GTPase HflX [Candidatus Latescibacterota bacterium]NIO27986.1 GTPase HflX [Candidatus Latescibacterota bacterium]
MTRGFIVTPPHPPEERAYLVGVSLPNSSFAREREYLDELEQLARTAGAEVVGKTIQGRTRIDGATYIGPGKAHALKEECERLNANLIIFDCDLTPAQARNLEKILNINLIDRTELILDIFARHAKTMQAKIQVELAQLTYTLPRLRKLWDHLSRQVGGIGTRGPGETQLEVDRRRVYQRMSHLKKQLRKISRRRDTLRRSRDGYPTVAIVGYTNAGKSTLLNALTGARTLVENQLFATLDTLTRRLIARNHAPVLLVDTVGFIRKLPHHLVDSFKATMDDIAQARLYLHVVDLSRHGYQEQMEIVDATLRGIENPTVETIHVFNKIDRVDPVFVEAAAERFPEALFTSAATHDGIDEVKNRIEKFFFGKNLAVEVEIPAVDGKSIAKIGSLLHNATRSFRGDRCVLKGTVDAGKVGRLERVAGAKIRYMF